MKEAYADCLEIIDEYKSESRGICMTEANEVMNDFMDKLSEGSFEKDNQPDNGPELTPDFVDKQVDSYSHILDSEIIESAICKSQRKKIYRNQDDAERGD